ncbi:acyl-protein synthetase [Taibaiella chishuiensis]|uniref:Acyl-protein synthetase LuxE n=1 Tax=Taibaiella chishuiensis TaxID=1434707 RepID=A0A2P8D9T6_9BACT|nr:acyl-protein synthetase [Taibaiella chishuiensis]PSK93975.1 acyl-protein synthetase LuxE [Taibaiella chishuiensis]
MLNDLLNTIQYSLTRDEKNRELLPLLLERHQWHLGSCAAYRDIYNTVFEGSIRQPATLADLPFLPVSAFKNHELKSIPDSEVFKVLTSSGTTGDAVSRIFLNKETAQLQSLALSKIITHVLGKARLPMLIIDSKAVFANKQSYSARGAGILGLSVFGKDHTYVLDDNFEFDEQVLASFLERYDGQPFFIFGFTFMVWLYLFNAKTGKRYDLSKAILIHSGGWKKMTDMAVDNSVFRASLKDRFGLDQIYNFYGMIEQIGSVFLENSDGYLHCPNFADVIIRNPADFSVQPHGVPGLVQVISVLPQSYPGHSLLTEDIGVIMGEDDASNGWKGKYFKVTGRAKKAELRGCSDTFKSR